METSGGDGVNGEKAEVFLSILPNALRIVSIAKSRLPHFAFGLLKLIFQEQKSESRFLYITETEAEISLILDQQLLCKFIEEVSAFYPSLPQMVREESTGENDRERDYGEKKNESDPISICSGIWKAMQVPEGILDFQQQGMVHSFSTPLAEGGVSIYYLSSCDSDFILVAEKELGSALYHLRKKFRVQLDSEDSQVEHQIEEMYQRKREEEEKALRGGDHAEGEKITKEKRRRKLRVLKEKLYLCKLKKEFSSILSGLLVKMIFFNHLNFFSYFETGEDEAGIVVDADHLSLFPDDMIDVIGDCWSPICVDDGPLGFVEYGIVHSISAPLANNAITTQIYFSTYYTDYTMVREQEIDTAISCLKNSFDIAT
eukprot:TRINITY_DN1333_c0_g1_i2.p1 TRINITY_DN1333_c0_g1~~TRINITY_DN1333_c0_g1_i2.p1  ORF type:complete len:372 (+),score=111.15 TRINITY_DN1333_c0_g1_i2:45-1160(+)